MNIPPPFPLPEGILVELSSQSSTLYPFAGWLTRLRIPSPKSNPTFSSTASSGGTVGAGAGGGNGHRGSGKSAPPDTGAVESGEGGLGDSARRCYCVLVGGNLLWEYASEADAAAAPLAPRASYELIGVSSQTSQCLTGIKSNRYQRGLSSRIPDSHRFVFVTKLGSMVMAAAASIEEQAAWIEAITLGLQVSVVARNK